MKVSKSNAVGALKAIGLSKADKLGDKDLNDRIGKLHKVPAIKDALGKVKDKEVKNLLQAMIEALKGGKKVEIINDPKVGKKKAAEPEEEAEEDEEEAEEVENDEEEAEEDEEETEESDDDEAGEEDEDADGAEADDDGDEEEEEGETEEEDEEEPVSSKKGTKDKKAGKDKKSDKKADKPKKSKAKVERNEWGHKLGTRAARIDAAISDKPKTIAQIGKDAKYTTAPFHGHMKGLVEAGFVVKKTNGEGEVVYFRKGKSKK